MKKERRTIQIPYSQFPTRIEVHHDGELVRSGGVQPGMTEATVKLPAPIEECQIKIIPCDQQGKPVGRGHIYVDDSIKPEPPAIIKPPVEPEDECGEQCDGTCENTEVVVDVAAEVTLERPEVTEPFEEEVDCNAGSTAEDAYDYGHNADADADADADDDTELE